MDVLKNGCFEKMDVLPKTFVQIILATKWFVRHSSSSPKQWRHPLCLLFCLYHSSMWENNTPVMLQKKSAKATFLTAISHLVAHFFAVALFEDGVAIFLANILRACAQRDRHAKTLLQIILQIGCCSSSPFNSFLPCLLHIAGFVSWIS